MLSHSTRFDGVAREGHLFLRQRQLFAGRDLKLPGDEVVWQFVHSVALLGPWQYYHGYCILVARSHATEFSQLPDAERRAYFEEMCCLARALVLSPSAPTQKAQTAWPRKTLSFNRSAFSVLIS